MRPVDLVAPVVLSVPDSLGQPGQLGQCYQSGQSVPDLPGLVDQLGQCCPVDLPVLRPVRQLGLSVPLVPDLLGLLVQSRREAPV